MLKAERITFSVPGLLSGLIKRRVKELGYKSLSGYIVGLILFDLWARKPHKLTQQIVNDDDQVTKDAVFREIVETFDQPGKTGGYFEHRIQEIVNEILEKKQRGE
jgi:hypothetical protein